MGTETGTDSGGARVLVVDDSIHERAMLSGMLHGFEVRTAACGEEALKVVGEFEPELIIMDLVMPGMDGMEACERIRSMKLASRPAIIMVSALSYNEAIAEALSKGADDFVMKPIKDIELRARVNAQLRICRFYMNVEQDKRNLETILDITKAVSSTLDAGEVLRTVVCKVAQITGATRCSILLVPGDNVGYVLASNDSPDIRELKIDLARYPEIREAIRTKSFLIVEDMGKNPIMGEVREFIHGFEGMSVLVVPIAFGEEVLGTLFLKANKRGLGFDEKEIELCRIVANASYPALRNARIFENTVRDKERALREKIDDLAKSKLELASSNEVLKKEIAERRLAEKALTESETRFRMLHETAFDGIIICTTDGRISACNPSVEKIFGYAPGELDETDLVDLMPKEFRKRHAAGLKRFVETGESRVQRKVLELKGLRKDKEVFPMELIVNSFSFRGQTFLTGTIRDITERKRLEEETVKAQKLESLGVLAGGIAHDFNNLLTGVTGNLSLVKQSTDQKDRNHMRLVELEKATLRAQELTQQLLTFAKGGMPIKESISIGELIEESARFTLRGSNVKCEFHIPEEVWPVEADAGQITQVINNIIINADQAMPEGGMITVRAENMTIGATDHPYLRGGRYVKVSVKDQGTGISEKHLPNIFDPYFTTKQKGSGLGLSSVYSIVKKHQGHIEVISRVGAGTTFEIILPASSNKAARKASEPEAMIQGSGKVLVLDDEEIIRDVAGEMLSSLGYEAHVAREGAEAVELCRKAKEAGKPFDAVITDLTIPGGMGGREVVKMLLGIDPGARVIVSSGYSNDPIMADFKRYGFSGIIAKPYTAQKLSKVLSDVLKKED